MKSSKFETPTRGVRATLLGTAVSAHSAPRNRTRVQGELRKILRLR